MTVKDSEIIEKAYAKVDSPNASYSDTKLSKERWIKFGQDCLKEQNAELKKILKECCEIVYAGQKWVHARNRINELIEK